MVSKGEGNTANQKGIAMKDFGNTSLRIGPIVITELNDLYALRDELDKVIEANEEEAEMNERMMDIVSLINEFCSDYGSITLSTEHEDGSTHSGHYSVGDKITAHN